MMATSDFGGEEGPRLCVGANMITSLPTFFRCRRSFKFGVLVAFLLFQITASGQPCLTAASNLLSWWAAESNAQDTMGLNHGVLVNGIGFAPGEVGQAFDFSTNTAHVRIPASASLNVGTNNGFTVEAWINPSDTGSGHPIVEWNSGSYGVCLWIANWGADSVPGSLYADIKTTGLTDHAFESDANVVTPGVLQHVALTYDRIAGNAALYLNGLVLTQKNLGPLTAFTTPNMYIGYRPSDAAAGTTFAGQIDEVSLYNRALVPSEIMDIYNAGATGKCPLAPAIIRQPQGQRVRWGTNVTLTATAQGTPLLNYQWAFYGTNLPNATNSSLAITNARTGDAGPYVLWVTNGLGYTASSNAVLAVDAVFALVNGQLITNTTFSSITGVTVQLQSVFANGYIFYTLDGSAPSFNSPQYSGPFPVTHSVVLRALAYSADFFQSGDLNPVNFIIAPPVSLTAATIGPGSVSFNPTGGTYISNTIVTVTATPSSGWVFLQWMGDATGTNASTSVTMNRSKAVTAMFGTSLGSTAAGNGSVTLNPPGGVYPYGTVVWLSGIPQSGSYFVFWGNAGSGNVNPLAFGVTNANLSVSSLFAAVPGGQASFTVVPVGKGRVTVNPRTNVCNLGQNETITALPDAGQTFVGWSGDASGTQNPLSISVNASKTIYANFSHNASLSARASFEGLKPEGFVLTLTGDFGARYAIDASSNLTTWTNLATFSNAWGTLEFVDSAASAFRGRFYRARLLP
jgi:uncharacterized repeat protein (TIGR02543 family)